MSVDCPSCLDYTTPVFIHHKIFQDGHDESTPSATGTFVKFRGRIFIVTCGHVLQQVDIGKHQTLSVMADRIVFPFSGLGKDAPIIFGVPYLEATNASIDLAIGPTEHFWSILAERRGKRAIDLDDWKEPAWENIVAAKAFGWQDGGKQVANNHVTTKGIEVTVGVGSALGTSAEAFTLISENAANADQSLSGISGGAIFGFYADGSHFPIGIVFEGFPGDSKTSGPAAFLKEGDLMVRGHLLTPSIFGGWLARSHWPK